MRQSNQLLYGSWRKPQQLIVEYYCTVYYTGSPVSVVIFKTAYCGIVWITLPYFKRLFFLEVQTQGRTAYCRIILYLHSVQLTLTFKIPFSGSSHTSYDCLLWNTIPSLKPQDFLVYDTFCRTLLHKLRQLINVEYYRHWSTTLAVNHQVYFLAGALGIHLS